MPGRARLTPQDPDVVFADQVAARLGIKTVQAVRDATARPGDPGSQDGIPGLRPAHEFWYSWRAVYEWLAGPGIPDGEIVDARELGRRIGASALWVRRASADPGTPGKIPGRRVGKQWRYAVEAVRAAFGGKLPGTSDPEGEQRP